MREFGKYILLLLVTLVIVSYALDFSFSKIYEKTNPRNKIALAYSGKTENYDIVFLGSSRANNHFDPKLFIDSGYKSYNYGMSGSRLEENALMLQLLLEKGTKIKNLVLEVDLNINSDGNSEGTRALFFPYLRQSETIRHYYKNLDDFEKLYHIPFYRFLKYEAKIGSRELFFSMIQKKSKLLQFNGFYALEGTSKKMSADLSDKFPKRNIAYEYIKNLCHNNKINLIAVTTPMCQNIKNQNYFDEVTKIYPEVHNLENVVTADEHFSSCGHMNKKGATIFSQYVLDKFFKK